MLVFYTWLRNKETGIVAKEPVITDYFIGDVGEVVKTKDGAELVVVDFAVENFPEGV